MVVVDLLELHVACWSASRVAAEDIKYLRYALEVRDFMRGTILDCSGWCNGLKMVFTDPLPAMFFVPFEGVPSSR